MPMLLRLPLLLLLLWSSCAWAVASKQYVAPETGVVFTDSGGGGNVVLPFRAVGPGAGRYSDRYDKGAGSKAANWTWHCQLSLTGANTAGQTLDLFVSWSDGTYADGTLSTSNGTLLTDKRRNLKRIGQLVVDQASSNVNMVGSGQVFIPTRYFSVAFWNNTSLTTQDLATVHKCVFYPVPPEMQ